MSILTEEEIKAGLEAAIRIRTGQLPSMEEIAVAPVLTAWAIVPLGETLFRLVGYVVGHPRVPDGACFTSAILAIDPELKWARTVSRLYALADRLDTSAK